MRPARRPAPAGGRAAVSGWGADLGAFVVAIAVDEPTGTAAFALGDGNVRLLAPDSETPITVAVHDGAVLALAADQAGGFITGGDDGALKSVRVSGEMTLLASFGRAWVEHIAVAPGGQTVACASGRDAVIVIADGRPLAEPRRFSHPSTVGGLCFDPKGKRLAAARYGGVSLWWAGLGEQAPTTLTWHGSHLLVSWHPGGQFIVTSMQESALHGWRVADQADMRMSGYPMKIKSIGWGPKGRWLATSGADRVVVWPFAGRDGPMGKDAIEVGPERAAPVTTVAVHPTRDLVVSGHADGAVWLSRVEEADTVPVRDGGGAPVTALAWSQDGSAFYIGTEDGTAARISFAPAAAS